MSEIIVNSQGKAYVVNGYALTYANKRIPDGYTELRHVVRTNGAWIDTGVAGATDLEITCVFSFKAFAQYASVYGNYIDENHCVNRALFTTNATSFYVAGGANLATSVSYIQLKVRHTLVVSSTSATLDGKTTTITAQSKTANTTNIALGCNKVNGGIPSTDLGLRIYAFSVKKGGVIIRDYVPARRESDSAVGFYDLANNEFIKSLTGTEFTAGPDYSNFYYVTGVSFNGLESVDTPIVVPENGTIGAPVGWEKKKGTQWIISSGNTRIELNGNTNNSTRYFNVAYDSLSNNISGTTKSLSFTNYESYSMILTPLRFGFGGSTVTYTKGNSRVANGLAIGDNYGHSGNGFTGIISTVYVYGSDAMNVTDYFGLSQYTPVATFKACIFNREVGFWCEETSTFYGNSSDSGILAAYFNY